MLSPNVRWTCQGRCGGGGSAAASYEMPLAGQLQALGSHDPLDRDAMEKFLSMLGASLVWSPLYALPAAIGVVRALLSLRRRNGRAYPADWATLYVPLLVWIFATELPDLRKSLGNVVEVPMVGLTVAALAIVRWVAAGGGRDRIGAWIFLVVARAAAVAVALLVPLQPE